MKRHIFPLMVVLNSSEVGAFCRKTNSDQDTVLGFFLMQDLQWKCQTWQCDMFSPQSDV